MILPENIAVYEDADYAVHTAVKAGFYTIAVLDDSNTMLLEDDGNVAVRTTGSIDCYFFGYGFDYIGAVQGIPVCFDAKECHTDTFPLANIHEHQVQFMEDFEKQGGISFLLIYYSVKDLLYYMRFSEIHLSR